MLDRLRDHFKRIIPDRRWLDAYVNHGRWVADCPRCNAGILLRPAKRPGLCLGCRHQYPIRWPGDAELVEAALSVRPNPTTRNWYPHETVGQLLAENARRL